MSTAEAADVTPFEQKVGHPPGLFVLFFAEMWERFSYYGMRALLVFYMTKGFLGYGDKEAYQTYGAYTALVYMTPFIGGMIADRVLGPRLAVIIGGILMAAGHLLMTIEAEVPFYIALALLICGNGFFKPNISTMVGNIYPDADRKDAGFTIFYMGINLGAAMAPLLCGYIGQTYGWHYGFGLATGGMLIGLAVFTMPGRITQILIGSGALLGASALVYTKLGKGIQLWLVNLPTAIALVVAAFVALWALNHGGVPRAAGAPPNSNGINKKLGIVVIGASICVPLAALLVSKHLAGPMLFFFGAAAYGYMFVEAIRSTKVVRERLFVVLILYFFSTIFWAFFEQAGSSMNNFADRNVARVTSERVITADEVGKEVTIEVNQAQLGLSMTPASPAPQVEAAAVAGLSTTTTLKFKEDCSLDAPPDLAAAGTALKDLRGLGAWVTTNVDADAVKALERDKALDELHRAHARADAVAAALIKAGASSWGVYSGTPAAISARLEATAAPQSVMQQLVTAVIHPFTELFAEEGGAGTACTGETTVTISVKDKPFTIDQLDVLRAEAQEKKEDIVKLPWIVNAGNVGMVVGGNEVAASEFQAANPFFILIFGLVFSAIWTFLGRRKIEPSTPVKFALGLVQLALGFAALWYASKNADQRGMVTMTWLLLAYLLHTTGELCLSPIGLSMVTKLSPKHLVATAMGGWFLSTAFSEYVAGIIATFTGVQGEGSDRPFPVPTETVHVYGGVFGTIGIASMIAAGALFALSPLLKKWMHSDEGPAA
jgi:POT family proton-dependent oligopeptide transporter